MRKSSFFQGGLAILVLGCCALPVRAQEVVETVFFDSITSANGITRDLFGRPLATSAIPDPNNEFGRSFTGNPLNTTAVGPITMMDFYLSATTVSLTSYQSIQIDVRFWDTFPGTGTNWLDNQLSLKSSVVNTLGALPPNISFVRSGGDTTTGFFDLYRVSLAFDTPVSFTDISLNGVSLNIKGNTGSGFFNTNNLSTFRTRGNGFVAGSSPATDNDPDDGGFLRNNSGRIDGNFTNDVNTPGVDLISGADQSYEALGMRLYRQDIVVVPEASTLGLLAGGALLPVVGLVRRRK